MVEKVRDGYEEVPGCREYYARPIVIQDGGEDWSCFLGYMKPGGGGPEGDHAHAHDHLVTVLEGTLLVKQGRRHQLLHSPQAMLVRGQKSHSFWNPGREDLELVMVNVPPARTAADAGASAAAPSKAGSGGGKGTAGKKELARTRKEDVLALILGFSDRYLDEEYGTLCAHLVEKLSRKRESPLVRGRVGIWAGSVIHAIGTINFLFDPSFEPYVSFEDIARHFDASKSAISQRSLQIRDLLGIEQFDEEFTTSYIKSRFPYLFLPDRKSLEQRARKAQESIGQSLRGARKKAMARTASRDAFTHVYQFKIALLECKPEIWRRIQVPGHYSFWDLHVAVQDAMGWLDYHLHIFRIPRPGEQIATMIGVPDPSYIGAGMDGSDIVVLPGWEEKIERWFTPENRAALYEYDLGDSWIHGIVLEDILPREPGVDYPRCLAGARACPPEDCGGAGGYAELLQVLAGPDCEERRGLIEWLDEPFDPEEFSVEEVFFDDPDERFLRAFSG